MITTSDLIDSECEVLHVPEGTTLAQLTPEQLAQLAVHHVQARWGIILYWRSINDQCFSTKEAAIGAYACAQLQILEWLVGEDSFLAATIEAEVSCQLSFAELEEREANLTRCILCNDERILTTASHLDERLCVPCERAVCEAACERLPICGECGKNPASRDSAGRSNRCVACLRSSDRMPSLDRPATRCPDCAAELDGVAYTGDRCWDCATKRLAPCLQCGGPRRLSGVEYEACGQCLVEAFIAESRTVQPGYSAGCVEEWRRHLASDNGRIFRNAAS